MNVQHKYKVYSTILDSFYGYLNSDAIYNRYWGFSDNPPHTEEEFAKKQFDELINRINRVPFDSEPADKGTCFNEVVDCIIENRKSDKMVIEKFFDRGVLETSYNNRQFTFSTALCKEFASYFKGAITQLRVEATLPTRYGDVLVYGVIDELMPHTVHDIKTTRKYSPSKYKNNFQHLVYPYCLMQQGNDIRKFEYNITDFCDTYTELYVFKPERDIPRLTEHVENFIEFIEENKELITDQKILGGENDK
ncbi:hypothetical protein EZS27_009361 [termite gut metagenome]|uniref:PD-(D/E)XK endonuclease-like domain-containing protein n=1 Tax=termite gut metagenome TaxID=433724 RepID=A0A5J4SCB9_9ZZZZ